MPKELIITDQAILDEVFELSLSIYDGLSVYTSSEKSFLDYLNDKELFTKEMNKCIKNMDDMFSDDEKDEIKRKWKYFYDNFENILDKVDYIRLAIDEEPRKFIDKYPILLNKNIVVSEYADIFDYKKINELLNKYKDCPNIHICLQGNIGFVRLDECEMIMNIINNYAKKIKSLNLSPLESIMYAYDIVRERKYKLDDSQDITKSRDIKNVLFENAIVCTGYARILECILSSLDIKNNLVHLESINNGNGHFRNAVYVDDSKYNVKGYYYLDPTWDSKKDDTNNYLLRYKYFMKTRNEMEELEDYCYKYSGTELYSIGLENALKMAFDSNNPTHSMLLLKFIFQLNRLYCLTTNSQKSPINANSFIYDIANNEKVYKKKHLKEIINAINNNINNGISAEVFIELVNNVRKIQHYEEPSKYPYSINSLYCIYKNSGWKFSSDHYNLYDIMEEKMFGVDIDTKDKNNFKGYIYNDTDIALKVKRIEVTKSLNKVLEKEKCMNNI